MDPQILQNYLEDNKYEEKFNIDQKFSFIYSLICIADKIMKNKLPYKMNTSNLIIITKDNNEYLKDNFDDLEIEIKNKIDEQSILFDLSIIIINILLGENISEEKINKNPKVFIKKLEKELIEIKSFVNFPKLIEKYLSKNDSLSSIQLFFKDEYPLNGQEKKIIENLINNIPDKEESEILENISEEKSNDNSSSQSSFSSYENEEEEKEEEDNSDKEEKIIYKGKDMELKDMELKEIQKSIEEYYEKDESKNELNFFERYEDFFQNKNFILTTEAKNRLMLLKNLIELKINILLEGPTGTAKTLSAEIICDLLEHIKQKEKGEKYKKKEIIKFNLSSETTIPDLLGRYISSNQSLAGIKMQDGPFIDAYKNGKILILDEI